MHRTTIIAEIGINHNGDLNIAKKMILEAKKSGVDLVKFQKRDIKTLYSKNYLESERASPWGNTQYDQKNGLEFNEKQYDEINKFCKKNKIEWFASAWDIPSVKFLKKYKLKYSKVASAMIVNLKLLNEIAKQKKYTFISTGMCGFQDIKNAIKIFKKHNCKFELMHCIAAYPFQDKLANLGMINILKKKYKTKVGYSGHEKGGLSISYAAVALGASSIERHFTLDRTMYGSDQSASITTKGLTELVGGIRTIEQAIQGSKVKKILDIEKDIAKKLRENL